MSREQRKMMDAEDKLEGESANPLTKLFRRLLAAEQIKPTTWNNRLTMFLNSAFSRVPKNARDIGQERNNFNRAIARPSMTWKTFQKAIQIMGCVQYRITIDMEWRGGRKTSVDIGWIKNPLSEIDRLSNQKTVTELDPSFLDGHEEPDDTQY